jgi:hypothetical protein
MSSNSNTPSTQGAFNTDNTVAPANSMTSNPPANTNNSLKRSFAEMTGVRVRTTLSGGKLQLNARFLVITSKYCPNTIDQLSANSRPDRQQGVSAFTASARLRINPSNDPRTSESVTVNLRTCERRDRDGRHLPLPVPNLLPLHRTDIDTRRSILCCYPSNPLPSRPGQPYPKRFHPSCPRHTHPYEPFTARKPLSTLCVERTYCPILHLVAEDMATPFILSTCGRFGPSRYHGPSRVGNFLEYLKVERDGVGEYRVRIFRRNAPPLLFSRSWTWTRWAVPCNETPARLGQRDGESRQSGVSGTDWYGPILV